MMEKIITWLAGDSKEYEKLEPSYFGRENRATVEKQIAQNKKTYKYMLFGLILLIMLVGAKGFFASDGFLYKEGNVIGLQRSSLKDPESFELKGFTKDESKGVIISFTEEKKKEGNVTKKDDAFYISQAAQKAEISKDKTIILPEVLDNGKKVKWKKKPDLSLLYIVLVSALLVIFARKNRYAKLREYKKKSQEDIFCALPGFINKLIILWKSGATLDEAIEKTMDSYSASKENLDAAGQSGYGFFASNITRIKNSQEDNLKALNDFALSTSVREFKRLTNIMMENRNKGSYLLDKLENERESIWEKRKNKAIEDGKKAETKLVIPMTILLGALIMVTAAPAFLQM